MRRTSFTDETSERLEFDRVPLLRRASDSNARTPTIERSQSPRWAPATSDASRLPSSRRTVRHKSMLLGLAVVLVACIFFSGATPATSNVRLARGPDAFVPHLRSLQQRERQAGTTADPRAFKVPRIWDEPCPLGPPRPNTQLRDNRFDSWPVAEPPDPPTWAAVSEQSGRHRVGWLTVVSNDSVPEYAYTLSHLSCYASRRGIPFITENWLIQDDRHFFNARLRTVLKHLPFYDWLLVTDADLLIVNSHHDIREWLFRYTDDNSSTDVVMLDRHNNEICACAFFVRNSPGGRRFIERWLRISDYTLGQNINWDNGLLLELIAQQVRVPSGSLPDCPAQTIGTWDRYYDHIECFDRHIRHLRGADPFAQYWDVTLYGNLKTPLGDISDDDIVQLRVLKPWSSFLRIADPRRHCDDDNPYLFWDRVLPTDVMIMMHNADSLIPLEATTCTSEWTVGSYDDSTFFRRLTLADSRAMLTALGWWNAEACHLGPGGSFDCQVEFEQASESINLTLTPEESATARWVGGLLRPFTGPHL